MLCRLPSLSVQSRIVARSLQVMRMSTADSNTTTAAKKDSNSDVEGYRPLYATKSKYDAEQKHQRCQSASVGSGQRPTAMQKRFLVLTKLYSNIKEIPEYVQNGTMDRMHDRMRVVFIVVGCISFFIIFLTAESVTSNRINRDRAAGKVVTSM